MLVPVCIDILNKLYENNAVDNIVETGTTYLTVLQGQEKDLREERSTLGIADWISRRAKDFRFVSIDLEASHQTACFRALEQFGLEKFVEFRTGNGADVLSSLDFPINFALLDSDSDADTILREYEAVRSKMSPNGIIVIDDAFKEYRVNKARRVIETHFHTRYYEFRKQAIAIPCGVWADALLRSMK